MSVEIPIWAKLSGPEPRMLFTYSEEVPGTAASMGVAGGDAQWECQLSQRGDSGSARCLRSPRVSPTVPTPPAASRTSSSRVRPWRSCRTRPRPESLPNWPGASGKTQIAVMIAESLWRSQRHRRADLDLGHRPGGGPVRVRAGVGGGHRPRAHRHGRLGRGPLRQLAGRNQAALARGPRRPAGDRRPERAVARRAGGPAADHQPAARSAVGRPGRGSSRSGSSAPGRR